jgi:hypothetical protein
METISKKRDRLYNIAMILSIIFGIILAVCMVLYKLNEDYFNGNIRVQQLMESVSTKEDEASYPKVNVKVDFSDGGDRSLVIPLETPIDADAVTVREEFTQNKYVISLPEYGENSVDEISLVGDLGIMAAAGAYSQNGNIVVEAYCDNAYDYEVAVSDTSVTVNFCDLNDRYEYKVVVWTPYLEESYVAFSLFEDELIQYADKNGIKLYLTWNLENEYSQDDIVEFSNKIGADMIIGVDLDVSTEELVQSYMAGICNTSYFMPDFNSAKLSIRLVEEFAKVLDLEILDFEEADIDTPLVYNAILPSAMIRICVSEKENGYSLAGNIVEGIENTISSVIDEWRQNNNESE